METFSLSRRFALTPALDTFHYAVFRIAYATRATVIRWCLAFANFLERGQAHAITRAAFAKGLGPPAGVTIPPPTFPSPDRRHLPFRGAPALFPDERARGTIAQEQATSVVNGDSSTSKMGHWEPHIIRVSESELRYEDFDDAPTAVYHAIPTLEGRPRGAHRRSPAIRRALAQGDVRITSK